MTVQATTSDSRRERQRRSLLLATVLGVAAAAASPGTTWPLLVGAMLACGWLAFGSTAGRGGRAVQKEAPLFGRDQLLAVGNHMLARCRARSQPFTIAVVELSELPEVRKLFGRRIEDDIVAVVDRKLRTVATSRGLAVRTGRTQFSLLLPGRDAEAALQALRTALGRAGCLEHDAGGEELVLLPNVKLDAVGPEHAGVESTYQDLCRQIDAMHPRQPATTSAISQLPTEPAALRPAPTFDRPPALLPPTMPMPL